MLNRFALRVRIFVLVAATLFVTACSTITEKDTPSMRAELLKLNADLSHSMIVERDKTLFEAVAVDDFKVLAPGGVVESKGQAVRGLSAWDVSSIEITNEDVAFHGQNAVVINRLDIDGTMQPIGRWGPLKSMRFFVYEDDQWRLVSQSLTPCLPKVIEIGRC